MSGHSNTGCSDPEGQNISFPAEERYRQLIGSLPLAVLACDTEGRITYSNEAARNLCGRDLHPGGDLQWLPASLSFDSPGPDPAEAFRQTAVDGQISREIEAALRRPDGELRFVQVTLVPTRDSQRAVTGFLVTMLDVTGQRRREQSIRSSEEQLSLAVESSGIVGTWNWNLLDDVVVSNERFAVLYGVDPERAASGVPIEEYISAIHPDDRSRVEAGIAEAIQTVSTFAMEYRLVADTAVYWVYARGRVHADETGRPVRFPGVTVDITERRRAENALRESEEMMRSIFESTPDCVQVLDLEGRLISMNQNACRSVIAAKLQTVWSSIWVAESAGRAESALAQARAGALGAFRTRGPADSWWEVLVNGIRDSEGRIHRLLVIARDITERRRTDQILQESERRYEFVSRATNDAVWDWDLKTGSVHWNPALEARFGHKREDIEGNSSWWSEQIHSEDRVRVVDSIQAVIDADGELWSNEYRFQRADGSWATVFDRGFIVHDEAGRSIRMVGSMLDLTERKRAEEKLRQSEERFSEAFSQAPVGMVLATPEGVIVEANQAFLDMIGYVRDEIAGSDSRAITHPDDRLLTQAFLDQLRDGQHRGKDFEKRYVRRDGSVVWVRVSASLRRAIDGDPEQIIAILENVTARKQAEEERERLLRELERSNLELSQFSHVVAHDLQTPIRMIRSYTELLDRRSREQLDDTSREFMRFVVEGADRMEQLVQGLLSYAQLGQGEPEFRVVQLGAVIDGALSNLEIPIDETDARITVEELPAIMGDAVHILQLFQNLIANAIKYRRADLQPEIRISGRQLRNELLVTVADNGQGIAGTYQELVFQPLKRLHGREIPGTGMGLAVCRKIVERHGGRIWVESSPGQGSKFMFTLNHRPGTRG